MKNTYDSPMRTIQTCHLARRSPCHCQQLVFGLCKQNARSPRAPAQASKASAERALDGRSLPPNVDTKTRPKTHEHTPNDSQRPTDIPPVTVTVTVGMIIVVTIVHTSVPSAAALTISPKA